MQINKYFLITLILLVCILSVSFAEPAINFYETENFPHYETIKVSPDDLFNVDSDTELVPLENTGQAAVAVYSGKKLVAIFADNAKFFKTDYSGALSAVVKLHNLRTENLSAIKLGNLLSEGGRLSYGPGSLNTAAARNALKNRLINIASNADDALVRSSAQQILKQFNSVTANYSDEFIRILQGAGLKGNSSIARAFNGLRASPLTYAKGQHAFLKNGMQVHITKLNQLGYDVVVHDVQGLKITQRATGKVFEIPAVKGLDTIDDIERIALKKSLKNTTKISESIVRAGQAVDAVRAKRISSLQRAFKRYSDASRLTKWAHEKTLAKAVESAQKAGLKVDFAGGFLKVDGRVLNSIDDVAKYVRPTNAVVALKKPGVFSRVATKISQSAAAGSKVAKVTTKVGKATVNVGGKVLKAASIVGLGATVVKAAAYGYCQFNNSDFLPPSGEVLEVSDSGAWAENTDSGIKTNGVFYVDADMKYTVIPNKEKNIDRVRACLRDAYDTEERNVAVKVILGVSEFFNPATLVEDLANWAFAEDDPLEYCSWKIYSDVNRSLLSGVNFTNLLPCVPNKEIISKLKNSLPAGKYHFALFASYDPDLYSLIEDPELNNIVGVSSSIYERYSNGCSGVDDCVRKEGLFVGGALIEIENGASVLESTDPVSGEILVGGYVVFKFDEEQLAARGWTKEDIDKSDFSFYENIDCSGSAIASTGNGKVFVKNGLLGVNGLEKSDKREIIYCVKATFRKVDESNTQEKKGVVNISINDDELIPGDVTLDMLEKETFKWKVD